LGHARDRVPARALEHGRTAVRPCRGGYRTSQSRQSRCYAIRGRPAPPMRGREPRSADLRLPVPCAGTSGPCGRLTRNSPRPNRRWRA
jgi:hypothetical protein